MPALHEKLDGRFCVRRAWRGCRTWQIDGKGVRFLIKRGVPALTAKGMRRLRFPRELLLELFQRGLIYVGMSSNTDMWLLTRRR